MACPHVVTGPRQAMTRSVVAVMALAFILPRKYRGRHISIQGFSPIKPIKYGTCCRLGYPAVFSTPAATVRHGGLCDAMKTINNR